MKRIEPVNASMRSAMEGVAFMKHISARPVGDTLEWRERRVSRLFDSFPFVVPFVLNGWRVIPHDESA